MRVIHEPTGKRDDSDSESAVLATRAETADGPLKKAVGLMFRRSLPDEYALAFRFDRARTRGIHTAFVFVPLDVVWVSDGTVRRVERLEPWRGLARASADLILELPAGAAAGVEPGDRIRLEDA